jgi:hypothetical protein
MPASFQEVGIGKEDLPSLIALATGNGTRTVGLYPRPLEKKDVEDVSTVGSGYDINYSIGFAF